MKSYDIAVINGEDKYGEKYICAYIVNGTKVDNNKVRAFLAEKQPVVSSCGALP